MDDRIIPMSKAMTYNEIAEQGERVEWLGLIIQLQDLLEAKRPDLNALFKKYNMQAESDLANHRIDFDIKTKYIFESLARKESCELNRIFQKGEGV